MNKPNPHKTLSTLMVTLSINVVLIFLLAFFALLPIDQQRIKILELAQLQADSRAQTAAVTMETALRGVDATIQSIGQRILDTQSSGQEFTGLLAALSDSLGSLVRGMFIINNQGIISAQSRGLEPNEIINVSDRRYFSIHKIDLSLELYVDQPVLSRRTNEWILLVSRAIRNSDGDLLAVVVASLEPERIQQLLGGELEAMVTSDQQISNPNQSPFFSSNLQLALIQGTDLIISQQPFDARFIGTTFEIPTMDLLNRFDFSEFPVYSSISLLPLTDLRVEVAYYPLDDLDSWYRYRNNTVIILLLVFTTMIIISTLVVNWIANREQYSLLLTKGIKEREALIREISHRTKNSLAIVAAMIQLKADSFPQNDYVQQLALETESRVSAMAQVYNHLDLSIVQGSIEIHDYIEELIELIAAAYVDPNTTITFRTKLDPVTLSLDHAVPLSIVLHELLTNSFKHAFGNRPEGIIELSLHQKDNRIYLEVKDDGVGVAGKQSISTQDNRESLGVSLVTQIVESQLNGSVKIMTQSQGGYQVSFDFPVTQAPFIHRLSES